MSIRIFGRRINPPRRLLIAAATWSVLSPLTVVLCPAEEPFRIEVVDRENGWPVPLVQLRTTHHATFVTDNAGVAAFDLPEFMGTETWLSIESDGYQVAADGFGFRGARLTPTPGGRIILEVERTQLAKRLGRLTGAGLFAESQRFGEHLDWKESGIVGCDSIQMAQYQDKLYWAWGDTTLAKYPLGLFHMTGATTSLRPLASLQPPVKLPLDYFRDAAGAPRVIAEMEGEGPTWLGGFAVLPDASGEEHFVATYEKINPPLEAHETGMCEWDDSSQSFLKKRVLWRTADSDGERPSMPTGHPVRWTDDQGDEWLLFGHSIPEMMIRVEYESWLEPENWVEVATKQVVKEKGSEKTVRPHRGSIAWNGFLEKWLFLFTEYHGEPSALGEIWLAQAESPFGPWIDAVKVATHGNYTFYNPRLHPELVAPDSPVVLFEGTYTVTFADDPQPTPRYDYNQILYRIDLDAEPFRGSAR